MATSLDARASRPAPGALRPLSANRRGAALPEYALLLGLFLAVVVGLVSGIGSHLRSIFGKANTELQSGDCATSGNCSVASVPPGGSGGSGNSGGSSGSGSSTGGGSSANDGGTSGSSGTPGGGATPTPPNPPAPDPFGGTSGGGGSGGGAPAPTLDIHPR